jgi:hypothetical protein
MEPKSLQMTVPEKRQLFGIKLDWTKRENPWGNKSDYDEKTEIADELTKQYGYQNANVYIKFAPPWKHISVVLLSKTEIYMLSLPQVIAVPLSILFVKVHVKYVLHYYYYYIIIN